MGCAVITGYFELPIAEAREQREAHGRAYAAARGLPWPMPPDTYGPGRQPQNREAYYQRYEAGLLEDDERGLALLLVTPEMETRAGLEVESGDRVVRIVDTRTRIATIEALPREWRDKLKGETRVPPSEPTGPRGGGTPTGGRVR